MLAYNIMKVLFFCFHFFLLCVCEAKKKSVQKNCIVGGGVSGIYTARMLLDRGHTDVVIFEATNETGGKAKTFWHEDVPHSMGACYTAPTYERVLAMAERYFVKNVLVGGRSMPNRDPLGWAIRNGYALSRPEAGNALSIAMQKWENLTGKLAWKFPLSRPKNMLEINMTLGQYFDLHSMGIMRALSEYSLTQPGYEAADDLPLFYALQWLSPSYFRLAIQTFGFLDYGSLFERMSRGMKFVYNTKILSLTDKALRGCGRVFMATPTVVGSLGGVRFPVHTRRLTMDVSEERRKSSAFIEYNTVTGVGGSLAADQATFFGSRNDQIGWSPYLRPTSELSAVSRGYLSPISLSEKDMDLYITTTHTNSSIARLHSPYFPRFSLSETVSGHPWKIWDMQGRNNVFYVGAHAAGFESIENIFKYVDTLFSRFNFL
jgi:hypothetical protein